MHLYWDKEVSPFKCPSETMYNHSSTQLCIKHTEMHFHTWKNYAVAPAQSEQKAGHDAENTREKKEIWIDLYKYLDIYFTDK